ncbi:acyl-CoA thioesterase [Tsukamurella hominis]|uniref:acyl-CoA thioesterase n=1 Tax=Tsukamurella hominis TaxID=1970232 RepID=UPI0039ED5FD0
MTRPADTDSPEARGGTPPAHAERIRVQYAETDMGGAAHAACALLWAERAEHGLLRSLGLRPVFPRRRVEVEYLAPTFFDDEIDVRVTVESTGTTSVAFAWNGTRGDTLCFSGRTVAVTVVDGATSPIPESLTGTGAAGHVEL